MREAPSLVLASRDNMPSLVSGCSIKIPAHSCERPDDWAPSHIQNLECLILELFYMNAEEKDSAFGTWHLPYESHMGRVDSFIVGSGKKKKPSGHLCFKLSNP